MAVYRYQVVSVGMWRGKIKRWNTTFHCTNTTSAAGIKAAMQALGWPNPGDAAGDCSGGVASITIYAAAGGVPLQVNTYFDWQSPNTWLPYTGTAWVGIPNTTPLDASGESALVIMAKRPGLSATGKPVYVRKYLHAIPSRTETDYTLPDIPAATVTSLSNAINTAYMYTPSGAATQPPVAEPWYGNHQRVRGRRRTTATVAAQSFSAGVLTGAATAGGGGGTAPQFQ